MTYSIKSGCLKSAHYNRNSFSATVGGRAIRSSPTKHQSTNDYFEEVIFTGSLSPFVLNLKLC